MLGNSVAGHVLTRQKVMLTVFSSDEFLSLFFGCPPLLGLYFHKMSL